MISDETYDTVLIALGIHTFKEFIPASVREEICRDANINFVASSELNTMVIYKGTGLGFLKRSTYFPPKQEDIIINGVVAFKGRRHPASWKAYLLCTESKVKWVTQYFKNLADTGRILPRSEYIAPIVLHSRFSKTRELKITMQNAIMMESEASLSPTEMGLHLNFSEIMTTTIEAVDYMERVL